MPGISTIAPGCSNMTSNSTKSGRCPANRIAAEEASHRELSGTWRCEASSAAIRFAGQRPDFVEFDVMFEHPGAIVLIPGMHDRHVRRCQRIGQHADTDATRAQV